MFLKIPKEKSRIQSPSIPLLPETEWIAKTRTVYHDGEAEREKGCTLYTHLWTTCMILRILKEIWRDFPRGKLISPEAERLAADHDIGKATPFFLSKIYRSINILFPWNNIVTDIPGGHAECSQRILLHTGAAFAKLAGAHHGSTPQDLRLQSGSMEHILGNKEWENSRCNFLKKLHKDLNLGDMGNIPKDREAITLGAVILADWLSSSMDLPADTLLPDQKSIRKVIENAGLLPVSWKTKLPFHEIFGFSPNPLQKACAGIAHPGSIIVIEAGMGSGKTEAALYLAHQLLAAKKANGLYFAMPTRLTSEKIYDRLNTFLSHTISAAENRNALLIHGEAWLNWILEQPSDSAENGAVNANPDSWFQSAKRALLAPFAAGTVDQALLSIVNVRHSALRAFALAGKVVVFDECHSYDAYTGELIAVLIQSIRKWGGTVIILSATLTAEAKRKFLGETTSGHLSSCSSYPLITIAEPEKPLEFIEFQPEKTDTVKIRHTGDDSAAMREALEHALRGEQVLWIENTVFGAQNIYKQLACGPQGIEVGLIHSRFPAFLRREQESKWVDLLGKNGADNRRKHGRILVATQILEQSVDVDADFLITRLAPGDMLFQRIGRLWRHEKLNAVRPQQAKREMLLLIPEECSDPAKIQENVRVLLPYDPYWMLRTCEIWKEMNEVHIPDDIRPVLEKIYQDRPEESEIMARLKQKMIQRREHEQCLANCSRGTADNAQSDEFFGTRLSDGNEVRVLLLRKGNGGRPLNRQLMSVFKETPIQLPSAAASRQEKVRAAASLFEVMVKVSCKYAPEYEDFPLDFLKHILWTGNDSERPVRAAYVDETGALLTLSGMPVVCKRNLSYHPKLGYCISEK